VQIFDKLGSLVWSATFPQSFLRSADILDVGKRVFSRHRTHYFMLTSSGDLQVYKVGSDMAVWRLGADMVVQGIGPFRLHMSPLGQAHIIDSLHIIRGSFPPAVGGTQPYTLAVDDQGMLFISGNAVDPLDSNETSSVVWTSWVSGMRTGDPWTNCMKNVNCPVGCDSSGDWASFMKCMDKCKSQSVSDCLQDSSVLQAGQQLHSENKSGYVLQVFASGSIAISAADGTTTWKTDRNPGLHHSPPYSLTLSTTGLLSLKDKHGDSIWTSGTEGAGMPPYALALDTHGVLKLQDVLGKVIWCSDSQCRWHCTLEAHKTCLWKHPVPQSEFTARPVTVTMAPMNSKHKAPGVETAIMPSTNFEQLAAKEDSVNPAVKACAELCSQKMSLGCRFMSSSSACYAQFMAPFACVPSPATSETEKLESWAGTCSQRGFKLSEGQQLCEVCITRSPECVHFVCIRDLVLHPQLKRAG
jgi:hypothetical protein